MALPERYELKDGQWDRIAPFFPPYRTGRPPKLDNWKVFNAILWIIRSGAPWRDLPERYGSWKTVYSRFRSWVDSGLFKRLFQKLSDTPDMENLSLDSTIVRAHQKATGAKKTRTVWLKIKPLV